MSLNHNFSEFTRRLQGVRIALLFSSTYQRATEALLGPTAAAQLVMFQPNHGYSTNPKELGGAEYLYCYLVGGLEWNMKFMFPSSWECHTPNWRTQFFQRGRYTTNQLYSLFNGWASQPHDSWGKLRSCEPTKCSWRAYSPAPAIIGRCHRNGEGGWRPMTKDGFVGVKRVNVLCPCLPR